MDHFSLRSEWFFFFFIISRKDKYVLFSRGVDHVHVDSKTKQRGVPPTRMRLRRILLLPCYNLLKRPWVTRELYELPTTVRDWSSKHAHGDTSRGTDKNANRLRSNKFLDDGFGVCVFTVKKSCRYLVSDTLDDYKFTKSSKVFYP